MVSLMRIICDYFMVLCIISGSLFTGGQFDKNLITIRNNIVDGLISGELTPFSASDVNDADDIISRITSDKKGNCYFKDVDYTNTDRSNWITKKHLNRTERLALLYINETDKARKEEYRDYILRLIDYWIKNDFQNSNWWYNKLATPNTLGEISLLMINDISFKQRLKIEELIGRGSFSVNTPLKSHAGANIIDIAMSTIKFGVLTNSRTSVNTAVKLVSKELKYSKNEGLRSDSTFFQHGNRLYMGGYGITFINGMADLIYMLSGTKYTFSTEQLSAFSGFINDGLRTMSFGNVLDPTVMGRSVSRMNPQPLKGVVKSLRKLAAVEEMPRKNEISEFADSIENNTRKDTGVHYFNEANFLVINNSDFYFSFRGGADELFYSEIINDENILGYNSSFPGVTTIMHSGNEYTNISPVLDYSMIPGTTSVYESDQELLNHEDFTYRNLPGKYGYEKKEGAAVSFAQTEHEGIKMTVACFATDRAAFILGCGFEDSKGRKLNTTIDQSYYTGNITASNNLVIHNGIKYNLISGGNLKSVYERKTGNWRRNNLMYGTETVEEDILTVYFENKGTYSYSVMPENVDEQIRIICNTPSIQAVELPDGRVACVFYKNGSFEFNGRTVTGSESKAYIIDKQ